PSSRCSDRLARGTSPTPRPRHLHRARDPPLRLRPAARPRNLLGRPRRSRLHSRRHPHRRRWRRARRRRWARREQGGEPMIRTRVAWLATAAILWAALVACGGADAAPTDGGSPGPLPTPNASSTETPANAIGYEDNSGFRNNQVVVINKTPGKLKLRANIQLDRITGPAVQPA